MTFEELKRLARERYPQLLCYGEPGGCIADEGTNETVCCETGCAILAAFFAGIDYASAAGRELSDAVAALAPHFNEPAVDHIEKWQRLDAAQKAMRGG